MEEWRSINGFENYQVSSLGRIVNLTTGKEIGFNLKKTDNYTARYCELCNGDNRRRVCVARVVAETFIPNPDNKPQVDHIDTDTMNNRVDNLRWTTAKENSNNRLTKKHQSESAKVRHTIGRRIPASWKKVYQYDKNGVLLKEWSSVKIAGETLGLHPSDISMTANNKRKSCGGYRWQWN